MAIVLSQATCPFSLCSRDIVGGSTAPPSPLQALPCVLGSLEPRNCLSQVPQPASFQLDSNSETVGTQQRGFCLGHQASPENRPVASLQSLHVPFSRTGLSWPSLPQPFKGFVNLKFLVLNHFPFKISVKASEIHQSLPCLSNQSIRTNRWGHWGYGNCPEIQYLSWSHSLLQYRLLGIYFYVKIIIEILWGKGHFKMNF